MSPALEIRDLKKVYGESFEALKGISMKVEKGDFFALLGANGAGKSTTIGIICSLITKTEGKVFIFGQDVDENFPKAKLEVGIVPQEFNFNQFEKVEDIIITQAGYYGIPADKARPKVEQLLKQLGLWEKRRQPSRSLSGGMKRRLMIARALVHEPKLLILDEPTAGVDIELRRSMWDFLKEINQKNGTTIILTTHYLEEAEQLCRNVAIIDKGEIIRQSVMSELLKEIDQEVFVIESLNELPAELELDDYSFSRSDSTHLDIVLKRGASLNPVLKLLDQQGVSIAGIRTRSNRLEEIFVNLLEGAKS